MHRRYSAGLRLVVNNSLPSSSPRSCASMNKGSCSAPGTAPRLRQLKTVFGLIPSSRASFVPPPKASISSGTEEIVDLSVMSKELTHDDRFLKTVFSQSDIFNVSICDEQSDGLSNYADMVKLDIQHFDGISAFNRLFFHVFGRSFSEKKRGDVGDLAELLGPDLCKTGNAVSNWARRGLPAQNVLQIAAKVNLDVYYLIGMSNTAAPFGGLVQAEANVELQERVAKLESMLEKVMGQVSVAG